MPDDVILDPLYMAAAISLTSPAQDRAMRAIEVRYKGDPLQLTIETSRYVIQAIGIPRIEAQAERMASGEIAVPPEVLELLELYRPPRY